MVNIQAQARAKKSADKIRKLGKIPAVFYGAGKESTPISIDSKDFDKVLKEAGESSTITLSVEGKDIDVLIHDVQYSPVKNVPCHVDFLAVDMKKKIQVGVPLVFEGVAPAVKNALGTLVKVIYEVEVEALPGDLPHEIIVNVESLDGTDSHISASDLVMPKGVVMITPGEEIIASISVQQDEAEEVQPADLASIEVEKKGKKDEEGQDESAV